MKSREFLTAAAHSPDDLIAAKTRRLPFHTMNPKLTMFALALGAGSATAAVIADFSAEFPTSTLGAGQPFSGSESPSAGWNYMWNPTGAIGTASSYQSLVTNTIATFPGFGGTSPMFTNVGNVAFNNAGQGNYQFGRVALTSFHPGVFVSGTDYRGIIAYTIQAGEAGTVSITNSSFAKLVTTSSNGVDLDIYVNDTLMGAFSKDGFNGTSSNFNGSLGTLSVGDTVYVMIGNNGNGNNDASVIDFQLESVPEPSAALLGGLGLLALLRRRRA